METHQRDFRYMVIIVGLTWCCAFLMIGWTTRKVDLIPNALWNPPMGQTIVSGRPIPQLLDPIEDPMPSRDIMRLAISAQRIGRAGGAVKCGLARLEVPPDAVGKRAFFSLEAASCRALAVDIERTATDLVQSPVLRISYAGTQYGDGGLDPMQLQIFREITLGIFQQIPSRVDADAQCVVAEAPINGRYVVG
jgi:hypothetical protein